VTGGGRSQPDKTPREGVAGGGPAISGGHAPVFPRILRTAETLRSTQTLPGKPLTARRELGDSPETGRNDMDCPRKRL
jgi:hypothetical protein